MDEGKVDLRAQLFDLDELMPDERNARTHDETQTDQLEASMRRFGWTVPMLIDVERGNLIVAGHGRRLAALRIAAAGEQIKLPGGRLLPIGFVPGIDCSGWTEDERRAYALADNQLALQAGWDADLLKAELAAIEAAGIDLADLGFDADALAALEAAAIDEAEGRGRGTANPGKMAAEFMIPPFSVLSAREGWWQERKRQWLALGIKSEVGRGGNLIGRSLHEMVALALSTKAKTGGTGATYQGAKDFIDKRRLAGMADADILVEAQGGTGRTFAKDVLTSRAEIRGDESTQYERARPPGLGGVTMQSLSSHPRYYEQKTAAEERLGRKLTPEEFERDHWVMPDSELNSGTSIFDPVLCEIAYRWWSAPGQLVLDPFAGGSVRGIVAAALGRQYVGVDLRPEQVAANRTQWPEIKGQLADAEGQDPAAVPPLTETEFHGIRVVRDDLVTGGTKRRALERVLAGLESSEFIYATPAYGFAQIALAAACRSLGKRATIVVAGRKVRHPRTQLAADLGAEIVEVEKGGYLTVVQKRAKDLAAERGAYLVPFGMDDPIFVDAIAQIALELPGPVPTEVWTVAGSGVLTRALQKAWPGASFHAVQIGKDPEIGTAKLWKAPEKFEDPARDPPPFPSCDNYDAKAWRFIMEHAQPGALFWNVGADAAALEQGPEPIWHEGDSRTKIAELGLAADFVFSCPPYGDLEVYSDDPADLSTLDADEFDKTYAEIIGQAVASLKPDRFACFVVGDYRDKRGLYRNFVSKTIAAFEAAGARLYNEAILVTSAGSLAIRAGKQFRSTRKLGKTHQNVLVFVKGDPRRATEALGPVDVTEALRSAEDDLAEGLDADLIGETADEPEELLAAE